MASPSQRQMTVGTLVKRGQGIILNCACGHKTALLPEQLAKMAHPETRLLDAKRRFRCSMCGRSGADEDVRMSFFAVPAAIAGGGVRPQPGTRH